MICHGDELGHTQRGNNNAYCQDNELTWIDWELTDEQQVAVDFVGRLIALPPQRSRSSAAASTSRAAASAAVKDIAWLAPDGHEMTDEAWNADFVRSIGMLPVRRRDRRGRRARRADRRATRCWCCSTPTPTKLPFTLPALAAGAALAAGVRHASTRPPSPPTRPARVYPLGGRSVALFKITPPLNERRREVAATRAAASSEQRPSSRSRWPTAVIMRRHAGRPRSPDVKIRPRGTAARRRVRRPHRVDPARPRDRTGALARESASPLVVTLTMPARHHDIRITRRRQPCDRRGAPA